MTIIDAGTEDDRLAGWERRTEWPLAGVAALFLAAYAWPILQSSLSHPVRTVCSNVVLVVWALFGVDYLVLQPHLV